MKLKYDDFTEAFMSFLFTRQPYLPGGGEIGGYNPLYVSTEIRIKLNENGSGYIHALGEDSVTVDFLTMDHFRSQGMITPEQREQINKLTREKATKQIRNK